MNGRLSRYKWRLTLPEAILIFITMIWGGTFMVVHHAMTMSGPFFCRCAFRYRRLAAAAFSLRGRAFYAPRAHGGVVDRHRHRLRLWSANRGMQTISGSQSAFITALYVPLVPLLQWIF